MAQQTHIEMIDDLDPDLEAHETVTFGLDGVTYEIDLHEDHAGELRAALEQFTAHGRRIAAPRGARRRRAATKVISPASGAAADSKAVREWAKENGLPVSDRGRLPAALVAQFSEATT